MEDRRPDRCILCNYSGAIQSAGFRQLYKQHAREPLAVPWWECPNCRCWFGSPHPTIEQIQLNWEQTEYNDPEQEAHYAEFKIESQNRILHALETHRPEKGTVLDYGCNFGHFLEMARQRGWTAIGAEAFDKGVAASREKGFQTHQVWGLEELELPDESLDAIASNDVFYYVWEPYLHLRKAYDLLKPGGALVIRTSNKLAIERFMRSFLPATDKRDRFLSRVLQGQFHSIEVNTIIRIMTQIGFRVVSAAGAMTAPPQEYSSKTVLLYTVADFLHTITGGGVNVSPGVMIVAVKH